MPTYEFRCEKCKKSFRVSYSIAEYERAKKNRVKCATCGSSQVKRQLSVFQVQTSKKS